MKRTIKYLGLTLDSKTNFTSHVSEVASSANKTAKAIGRLMTNIVGPSQVKRKLLSSVVNSKLLYAARNRAPVALLTEKNKKALIRPQKLTAIRAIRAYRTVSDDAALLLAFNPPVDLLAEKRRRVYIRIHDLSTNLTLNDVKVEKRALIIEKWQARWNDSTKGAWTRRLIPNVSRWLKGQLELTN